MNADRGQTAFMVTDSLKTEARSASITVRVRPSIKAMAEHRAAALNRSLANYVEELIRQDVAANPIRAGGKAE